MLNWTVADGVGGGTKLLGTGELEGEAGTICVASGTVGSGTSVGLA
jgi:hypothetical protein